MLVAGTSVAVMARSIPARPMRCSNADGRGKVIILCGWNNWPGLTGSGRCGLTVHEVFERNSLQISTRFGTGQPGSACNGLGAGASSGSASLLARTAASTLRSSRKGGFRSAAQRPDHWTEFGVL